MPNKDGMGPEGKGPRTGRGLGSCSPSDSEQKENNSPRLRRNGEVCGRGLGRGRNRCMTN